MWLAGLRRQRFGREVLVEVLRRAGLVTGEIENLPRPNPDWRIRLAQEAPPAEKGVLAILGYETEPLERDLSEPHLLVRESRIEEYEAGIRWLNELGAFRIVIDER
jgi:hypothetical protein